MGLVADAMLGRLARWLRVLGRDVVHDEALDDRQLADLARSQGRLLLTRDRRLCAEQELPTASCRLVASRKPAGQLPELFRSGWRDRLFMRCLVCNTPLEAAGYGDVADALPAEVRTDVRVRSAGFRRCPGCRRVYWEGSHTRRMRRWLEAVSRTT